jgi:hypothetical protein
MVEFTVSECEMTSDQKDIAMTTISILPVASSAGRVEYQAVSGSRVAVGLSAGQAPPSNSKDFRR